MGCDAHGEDRGSGSSAPALTDERMQMSWWRWLLFSAMARFETPEDRHLRIPGAKTVRQDVLVDLHSGRELVEQEGGTIE